MIKSIRKAVQIFDSANIPTRDRMFFDGETIIDLNADRQAEEGKAISKLPKKAKRRTRGAKRVLR